MSFGVDAPKPVPVKKFISQSEINEQKVKRQAEWEKVRKPEEPLEVPEEVYDPRTLYQKLEEQKQKKQDEHDAQFKMINQVKGLDEGEANFLNEVAEKQLRVERQRKKDEEAEINEYKSNWSSSSLQEPSTSQTATDKVPSKTSTGSTSKKSQMQLLAGAVKRKGRPLSPTKLSESKKQKAAVESSQAVVMRHAAETATAQVLGVLPAAGLPGVAEYSASSDSASSSSDSDVDTAVFRKHVHAKMAATHNSC